MRIGVLSYQGDVSEHMDMISSTGHEPVPVKTGQALSSVHGLILPGGESTCQGKLLMRFGLDAPIRERIMQGMPVFGTCTGAILLARTIAGSDQPRLGTMDIEISRNAFGAQVDSFETELDIKGITDDERYGRGGFKALFIRAPLITRTGPDVEVMAAFGGNTVLARQSNMLACSFHPEMGEDARVHRYFADMVEEYSRISKGVGI
ncbi:MAG TPA: pyridoxal 5'-phosphate synthase glutaminase subunit PdxT [Bacillota bacterium]|nr:MAG: Glutamine amidotransferase subunit PdxT [Firmicutes bacterium ADurb.Bin153]HNV34493.1 pyridoxal 5'-phosphate synthase glutaminase subunit PdxT [Bacillota bacterium]